MKRRRRSRPLVERYWSKVRRGGPDECWLWRAGANSSGYGVIRGDADTGSRMMLAHRIALILDGRDPGELGALHSCDTPRCQNPAHLRVGTQTENVADMNGRGRHAARLSPADCLEIRLLAGEGATFTALAVRFGVSRPSIANVVYGRTWRVAA